MLARLAELGNSNRDYEYCVVGSGPAGMSLALILAKTGKKICLLEAGDLKESPDDSKFFAYQSRGAWNYENGRGRSRFLGGSSNCWGGLCSPLDEEDFLTRDWIPNSGWPFPMAQLKPYYSRACEILDTESRVFQWNNLDREALFTKSGDEFKSKVYTLSPPTRLKDKYQGMLRQASNLEVILGANLKDIDLSENKQSVSAISVASLDGKAIKIKSRFFVLACGGIENSRILLNCRSQMEQGIGNQNGNVGKYFMEHIFFPRAARLYLSPEKTVPNQLLPINPGNNPYFGYLQPTFSLQKTLSLMNMAVNLAEIKISSDWLPWGKRFQGLKKYYDLEIVSEMYPRAENRISLGTGKDPMGHQLAEIALSVSEGEYKKLSHLLRQLAMFFGRKGLGRIQLAEEFHGLHGGSHHMGGTRAGVDPKTSVVDENLKVHGIDNLYCAGSSVFPTGGVANPTLNLVVLSLRLADHLKLRS